MTRSGWAARLALHYRRDGDRTVAHDRHEGPLRVLKALYPEGESICHHVIVHPPGGVVGGDDLAIDVQLEAGAHTLITTPGATRFYRSAGPAARLAAQLTLAAGARLEWLPLETIAHRDCRAENRVELHLAAGAECLGWDLLALGLPAAGEAFDRGSFQQHLALDSVWLERGSIRGDDQRLLHSPLGLGGASVLATLWFAAGNTWPDARRERLLDVTRALIGEARDAIGDTRAGATAAHPQVLLLRVLADRVEPAMALLRRVRAAWRAEAWALHAAEPRVWST